MKVAINFHAAGSVINCDAVALRGRRKAQPLLSRQGFACGPTPSAEKSKPNNFDDAPLRETIRLAQQGDSDAFEIIYQRHAGRAYAICLRILRDPVEAEDALQDAFMQLFRKIHTFRGESAFSSWLHRLTVNAVLMRVRQKKPISVPFDESVECDDEESRSPLEIGGLDLRLTGLVDRLTLQAAIKQLPAGYRRIFILHDVHGYEHSEIAKLLGRSTGNSKSQLHKARKRLRELLQTARALKTRNDDVLSHSLTVLAR